MEELEKFQRLTVPGTKKGRAKKEIESFKKRIRENLKVENTENKLNNFIY